MAAIGMQMQPIVMTTPDRADLIAFVQNDGPKPLPLQACRCGEAGGTGADDDGIGVLQGVLPL